MMAFDLAAAKARLNITGTSQDVQLQGTLDTALAIVETYLDRKLEYATETIRVPYFRGDTIKVRRWPIDSVTAVTHGYGSFTAFKVDYADGLILFNHAHAIDELSIEYSGGFTDLPADLLFALWGVFDAVHAASSGGTATVAAGTIESVTIPDVGTVRFASGASAASAGASSGGLIPAQYLALLDRYRNHAPIGVG